MKLSAHMFKEVTQLFICIPRIGLWFPPLDPFGLPGGFRQPVQIVDATNT